MRQPWLQSPGEAAPRLPDDFSPHSAIRGAGAATLTLAVALLLLAAGRSAEILDAAYGLPIAPGTEALIALAEAWDGAMAGLGVPEALAAVRGVVSAGR